MPIPKPQPSYRVAFDRLLPQLLPVLLRRGPRLRAWFLALLSPLTGKLYPDFLALVSQSRRELTCNRQTIVLRAALNDRFDLTSRRIEIRNDDTEVLPQYLFFERELRALPTLFFRDELPTPPTSPLPIRLSSGRRASRHMRR